MNKKYEITARWNNMPCFVVDGYTTAVQINNNMYCMCDPDWTDERIIDYITYNVTSTDDYLEEVWKCKRPEIYNYLQTHAPDWSVITYRIRCECGSDITYGKNNTAHSYWCPKYKANK